MTAEEAALMPANNEAKIEGGNASFNKEKLEVVVEPSSKLIGLSKEELESFRNDPFWKTIRMVLFVAFWVLWAAMFGGAILIVVLSPKCAEKQLPKWWQTKVSYQLLVPTFFDSDGNGVGDLAGVAEKLDQLRKIGVTTVYPSPLLQTRQDEFFDVQAVVKHDTVDPRYGNEADLQALIDAAHNKDMFLVLDMPLSSVSKQHEWMQKADPKNDAAFIWKTVRPGEKAPANFYDAPARGGKKYLGYPDADHPVLNWNESIVKNAIKSAIHKLLDMGVDGFNLDHVARLAVNSDGTPNHDGAVAALTELTTDIRTYVSNSETLQDKDIVLFSSLRDVEELHTRVTETGELQYAVDTAFARINKTTCGDALAKCVHDTLSKALAQRSSDGYTPFWQFSNADTPRLADRFDPATANLLTFMQLTMPGALSLYYGQELGLRGGKSPSPAIAPERGIMQWSPAGEDHHGFVGAGKKIDKLFFPETGDVLDGNNFESQYAEERSALKVFKKLAQLRQREEVMIVGETKRDELQGDVVVFSRIGHSPTAPVFLVALNFGNGTSTVDFAKLSEDVLPKGKSSTNAEVTAATTDLTTYRARDKIDMSKELELPAKQGILLRL